MITSGSSPPCSLVAMDSPLFYELQDHCHDVNSVTKNQSQQQRRSVPNGLHLNLNTSSNSIADLTSARGLAPIRVPPSGAVFGNAPQQQQQNGEASYAELADINTPEISLDLQNGHRRRASIFSNGDIISTRRRTSTSISSVREVVYACTAAAEETITNNNVA
ncbi:putative Ccaat/enhancer binding protein c/ebp [Daphnia magna]|uniref:Putative Ccaat/enhancer binding protein c/ebp n=1 Tax=Daphnia magna TaxID=35525 RepID=A0A164VLF3_9CRUS|nr:putative Ccaat/enhancer binding protein c/ebp [Daphnia magna]